MVVERKPKVVHGNRHAILTPNVNEFKRLCSAVARRSPSRLEWSAAR